jgi:hypothetical protein
MNSLREKANEARRRANAKCRDHKELVARSLDPSLLASEQRQLEKKIADVYPEVAAAEREADRQEALAEAREKIPVSPRELAGGYGDSMNPWPATARGELEYTDFVYRPGPAGASSFGCDVVAVPVTTRGIETNIPVGSSGRLPIASANGRAGRGNSAHDSANHKGGISPDRPGSLVVETSRVSPRTSR